MLTYARILTDHFVPSMKPFSRPYGHTQLVIHLHQYFVLLRSLMDCFFPLPKALR